MGTSLVVQWLSACLCRKRWFDPWSRKIQHATRQLSPCFTTAEPTLCRKRSYHHEKPAQPRLKSSPRSPQLEKACVQQGRSSVAKNKWMNELFFKKGKKVVWFGCQTVKRWNDVLQMGSHSLLPILLSSSPPSRSPSRGGSVWPWSCCTSKESLLDTTLSRKRKVLYASFLTRKEVFFQGPPEALPWCLCGQNWVTFSTVNQSWARGLGIPWLV